MDDPNLARTLESILAESDDLARTFETRPRETIEPPQHVSAGGEAALSELRRMTGSLDGRIAIHETIGEGGMGVVHLATQSTLGRLVAVKTLRAGAGNREATLRILREAWVTGALEHPNVVPVYDVAADASGAPVIVMKRIEGRHWGELMHAPDEIKKISPASDPLEWNVRILASVCNAVHFAHSRGILHRDLKPENVMIGSFGEVYVLDWGIAISTRDDPSGRLPSLSQATGVAGTPCYMAPEMLLGDPTQLSARTDVYLLGAMLFEIFAGRPPHEGTNLQAMIASILLSTSRFPEGFPYEAQRICRTAMSREPAHRYESAEGLRAALDEYLRHRGSRKLAHEAKQSLATLLRTIENEPHGEESALAVFNLLGECRFGYRAALSAWPENEAARKGLDRALLAVIEHELVHGDPAGAATLLREVAAPPPEVKQRVESSVQARSLEDERLRRLSEDLDPEVGSRTRSAIGGILGTAWVVLPLLGWARELEGRPMTHAQVLGSSVGLFVVALLFFVWARQTLTKTLLNRRLSATLGSHFAAQIVLEVGALLGGIPAGTSATLHVLLWSLTLALVAIWVERWFAICAVVSALAFLGAMARPPLLLPLMALCNLVFTAVLLRVWLPRQEIEKLKARREKMRSRARRLFLDARQRHVADEEAPE